MTNRMLQTAIVFGAAVAGVVLVTASYDRIGGVLMMGTLVVLISIVILPRLAPAEDRKFLTNVLILALAAKMAATGFRAYMNEVVYGFGDLNLFDRAGTRIAADFRAGDWAAGFDSFSVGTNAIHVVIGLAYTVFGTTFFGMFLLSGFIGFLGAVLFYRAFRIAFPNGDSKLYAALIFFYPAVLYWPTGFGKDVLVFTLLGLTVWGAAMFIIQSRLAGVWITVTGLLFMFILRPEIGLIASIAFITAFVLRTPSRNKRAFTIQVIGVPVILFAGFSLAGSATSFLGIQDLSPVTVLDVVTRQSSQVFDEGRGGSNFTPPTVGTPTWIPEAFITVLFRPFPWEVRSLVVLVQSFDGALLGMILLLGTGKILRALKSQGQNPIMIMAILFVLMSVIALGTLGNFGLLARQRVIVLPMLFFIIAAAEVSYARRRLDATEFDEVPERPVQQPAQVVSTG